LIFDTRLLFLKLLRTFEIETVCDVGSLDGYESLLFRRALPAADIIALEPNPRNFALIETNPRLQRPGLQILPLAASDRDSEAPFFVVQAEYADNRDLARRGMSSLHRRPDSSLLAEVVYVRTVRLDNLLAAHGRAGKRIALWIDAEGMGFEVIAGASGVLDRTQLLHVEVETAPCIGTDQRLFSDVARLATDAGFTLLATDQPRTATQFNALYVRNDLLREKGAEIRWLITRARMYRSAKAAVRPLVPPRVRRFLRRRLEAHDQA
jgi:FkbM family methyltransferase